MAARTSGSSGPFAADDPWWSAEPVVAHLRAVLGVPVYVLHAVSGGCRRYYPARAGGPWLCSTFVRSGFHAVVVPSGLSTSVQPHR